MSYRREHLKPIRMSLEASSSIHDNVSKGYVQITPDGTRTFIPYQRNELGEIHGFISPTISKNKRLKWTKTRDWKDKEKASKSKWKMTAVMGGLNTVSK